MPYVAVTKIYLKVRTPNNEYTTRSFWITYRFYDRSVKIGAALKVPDYDCRSAISRSMLGYYTNFSIAYGRLRPDNESEPFVWQV